MSDTETREPPEDEPEPEEPAPMAPPDDLIRDVPAPTGWPITDTAETR